MEPKAQKNEIMGIDIRQIVGVLLQRIWIILFSAVVAGLVFMIYTKMTAVPVYTSSTKLYVLRKGQTSTGVSSADYQLSAVLAQDYLQLITSRTVTESVISELGLDMRAEELAGKINVSMPQDSARIIVISVTDTDPYMAQKLATAVRETASVQIKEVMDSEAVNVVEEANIPQSQNNMNLKKNGLIGGVAGIVISAGIILLMYLMNDTVKTPEDVERYLELSVLGSIPMSEEESKRGRRKKHKSKQKGEE